MGNQMGIPKGAVTAVSDMLDSCAKVQPGHEVVILAHIDGLYGSDNLVDQQAVAWIQSAVQNRGANASVLWIDEVAEIHKWRFPPVVKAVLSACDIFINNSFDIVWEELLEFRRFGSKQNVIMVRNFATTSNLLCTKWAQTPYELVSEIRYQASIPFKIGEKWQLTDDNGTHLEGTISPKPNPHVPPYTTYSVRREDFGSYRPWPEWVYNPIRLSETNGIFIFDRMLSWWSRYIGISPYFRKAIQLEITNGRITKITGGDEAEALNRFLVMMKERVGESVYDFNCLHFGVHPQASVEHYQCPNILYHRIVDHSHSSNIHVHIGGEPPDNPSYPYWMHCTGDIRTATFRVGSSLVHDRGHLTALDHPDVIAVAEKYPGRPGLQ